MGRCWRLCVWSPPYCRTTGRQMQSKPLRSSTAFRRVFPQICFEGNHCMENAAMGKKCNQTTAYPNSDQGNKCNCAINNNASSEYIVGDCNNHGNCIRTTENDMSPRWSVDLGRIHTIHAITIVARESWLSRTRNVVVSVDSVDVYTFPMSDPPTRTNLTKENTTRLPLQGQHITLSRVAKLPNGTAVDFGDNGLTLLNICEVQVWTHNPCSENPCQHGGTCQFTEGDNYTCNCPPGYKGANCSLDIDNCMPNPCANGGNCSDAVDSFDCLCPTGYNGTKCKIKKEADLPKTDPVDSSSTTLAIGVSIGASVFVILLIVVITLCVVRQQRNGAQKKSENDNETQFPEIHGHLHDSIRNFQRNPLTPSRNSDPGSNNYQDSKDLSVTTERDNNQTNNATKTTVEYANIDLSVGQKYEDERRKTKNFTTKVEFVSSNRLSGVGCDSFTGVEWENEDDEDMEVYNNGSLYASYMSIQKKNISLLDDFLRTLLDRIKTSDTLGREFKEFPKGMPHPHEVGTEPENRRKNRFQKLWAYDKNRVILKRPANASETDYINASWIKGIDNERTYIATQGPRENTVSDLWWMVWEENVTQIVMLTNLKEDGKDKCTKYWPEVRKTATFGHMVVTLQSVEERADFIIRTFSIHPQSQKAEEKLVRQYHYVTWPDHSVPEAYSLVSFWRYVTARASSTSPPLLHCSAGVGRTGTYIGLDLAMSRLSRGHDVNLREIVMELREQRSIMVQTPVQYTFLHEVVLEAYISRNSRLTAEQLELRFPTDIDVNTPNKTIDDEYKLLAEMKTWTMSRHETALLAENRDKNRDQDALPDEDKMAYLTIPVKGRNQYINAVYLSSFRRRRGLLLTQLPLPHTLVDLWRLVEGCDVTTIISLGAKDDDKTVKNFCRYWPRQPDKDLTFDPYKLSLNSLLKIGSNIISYSVNVKHEDKTQTVTIVHYTDWSGEVPGSISDLVRLIALLRAASDESDAPVIIQCLDGAARSAMFCALYDVISRLQKDGEASIFSTVRYLQCVRQLAVDSEKQYRYLYKVAQELRRCQSVYANI